MRLEIISTKCAARSKRTGLSCENPVAHPGGRWCRMHLGNSPHEIERVRQRFLEARGDAVDRLAEAVQPRPVCDHCGTRGFDALALAASKVILENCPPLIDGKEVDDRWLEFATKDEALQLASIMAACIERMRDEGLHVPDVIDVTPEPETTSLARTPTGPNHRGDAFTPDDLPSPRGARPEGDVNEAHSKPPVSDDDDAEEFDVTG
jgi:hypothetical protein